eukprot:CAMPEP_0197586766 /NCGR_PEP_ID=MMETSP1326-20131121/8627_1 /TAXON_ID=1155430 /ORGANISM="Genus nov. species nov., Strain RCC2288" /LENGTH=188 /DNA_ID=CAMNT_0043151427 /DNA_START=39 /DNA_END=605 /DNA_ORIENTATION=+
MTMSALRVAAPVAAPRAAAARKASSAARAAAPVKAARRSVKVFASESEVTDRLNEALKLAEECLGECSVMWDEVEELSQAASDKKPKPSPMDPVPISAADMQFIKETQEALAKAKAGTQIDVSTLRLMEQAAKATKSIKVDFERLAKLDKALMEALKAAEQCTGEDCAVEWETVEEISAAKSKARNTD